MKFGTELSLEKRNGDPSKLVGERLRVFDGAGGERIGTVDSIRTAFGGSTKHMIRFEGGSGTSEAVLLQKLKGAKKGLKFHVLDPADGAGVHAASAMPPSAAESDAGNAAAHTVSERVEALELCVLGEASRGGLLARVLALELASLGAEQAGSLLARVQGMEAAGFG